MFLVGLETRHVTASEASADGSFAGSVESPRGTSVLVKADPFGLGLALFNGPSNPAFDGTLSAAPGTILRVLEPPAGAGVPFGAAGSTTQPPGSSKSRPGWTIEGTINTQSLGPGATLTVKGTIRVASAVLASAGAGPMTVNVRLRLDRLSAPDGSPAMTQASYASTILTPTGLPIERQPRRFNAGMDRSMTVTLTKIAPDRAEGQIDLSMPAGVCLGPGQPSVTIDIPGGATPTFAVFVGGQGIVPFDPAANRVFVRFTDASGVTRGATSVAIRTQ